MEEFVSRRLNWFIGCYYNGFHNKLIKAAMKSNEITDMDFVLGCIAIHKAEKNDLYSKFIPNEFKNVVVDDE